MKQLVQVTALARGKVTLQARTQPSAAASVSPSPSSVTQVRLILQGGWSGGGRRVWIYGWGSVRSSCIQSSCIARYVQMNNAPSPPIYVGLHPHNLWMSPSLYSPCECHFPGGTSGKESTCQCRRCRVHPWVGKIPWRRKWQPTPAFLPGESHGQRSLAGYSPWVAKSQTLQLSMHAYTWKLLTVYILNILTTKKRVIMWCDRSINNVMVVTILQYIPNQHIVHLKFTQWYMSIMSQ